MPAAPARRCAEPAVAHVFGVHAEAFADARLVIAGFGKDRADVRTGSAAAARRVTRRQRTRQPSPSPRRRRGTGPRRGQRKLPVPERLFDEAPGQGSQREGQRDEQRRSRPRRRTEQRRAREHIHRPVPEVERVGDQPDENDRLEAQHAVDALRFARRDDERRAQTRQQRRRARKRRRVRSKRKTRKRDQRQAPRQPRVRADCQLAGT